MKKSLLFILAIALTYGSCKEIEQLTHFYMDLDSEVTIPPTVVIDIPIDIWTPNIPTNSNAIFGNNNTSVNLIEAIILKDMDMIITSPEDQSFDFLKSIELYLNADGVEEKKIAWLDDIPQTGLTIINLQVTDEDLKDFIKKDSIKIRSTTITRQMISKSTDIEIKSTYFVDAKLLGI